MLVANRSLVTVDMLIMMRLITYKATVPRDLLATIIQISDVSIPWVGRVIGPRVGPVPHWVLQILNISKVGNFFANFRVINLAKK